MIEIELAMQPMGEQREVDGLIWGGPKPVPFQGMTKARDGLMGTNGTYLFRPVCYDAPSCFVPRRCDAPDNPCRGVVREYPDSDPIRLIKIKSWHSEAEIRKRIEEGKRPQKVKIPLPGDLDRPMSRWRKDEWIKIGVQYGLDEDEMIEQKKTDVQEAVLRAQAASQTHPAAFKLYLYMSAIVGDEEASRRMNSIRYAVIYRNGEVLYLSDMERLAPWASNRGLEPDHRIKDLVTFEVSFSGASMMSAAGNEILSYRSNSRHGDLALRHLFENQPVGWIEWKDVVKAAGLPESWLEKRSPLRHLHGGNKGAKQRFFEHIIETRKNDVDSWEIRLSPKFRYKVE